MATISLNTFRSAFNNDHPGLVGLAYKCDQVVLRFPFGATFSMPGDSTLTLKEINDFRPSNQVETEYQSKLRALLMATAIDSKNPEEDLTVLTFPERDQGTALKQDDPSLVTKKNLKISTSVKEKSNWFGETEKEISFTVQTKPNAIVSFAARPASIDYYDLANSVPVQFFQADADGKVQIPSILITGTSGVLLCDIVAIDQNLNRIAAHIIQTSAISSDSDLDQYVPSSESFASKNSMFWGMFNHSNPRR